MNADKAGMRALAVTKCCGEFEMTGTPFAWRVEYAQFVSAQAVGSDPFILQNSGDSLKIPLDLGRYSPAHPEDKFFASTTYAEECERVLDPQLLSLDEAVYAALILHRSDPEEFVWTLVSLCSRMTGATPERLCRALEIIEKLGQAEALLPWLRTLTANPDKQVRSKAVKVFCKAVPSKMTIEELLHSPDSRVRANAIEALWFHQTAESGNIFRDAFTDPSHRVVVNALIGLCHQNDETALQTLLSLSQHPSEMFRVAAIWAFSHLYDNRAISALRHLLKDESETIRRKAAHVLAKLLYVQ